MTIKRASFTIGTATTTTIVAAVTGRKIRVLAAAWTMRATSGNQLATWKSGTDAIAYAESTTLTVPVVLPHVKNGWFETADGAALNLTTSTAGNVSGVITYVEV